MEGCLLYTSGASAYGKSLVNTQELYGSYSDTYIDAPFYTNHDIARSSGYYSGDYSEAQTKLGNAMKDVYKRQPDNRRTYPWGKEDVVLVDFHRDMIRIHKENEALRTGSCLLYTSRCV